MFDSSHVKHLFESKGGEYAIKLAGRWEEGVKLPWASLEDLHRAIHARDPEDISALTSYFGKKMYGGVWKSLNYEDVESWFNGEVLEVEFRGELDRGKNSDPFKHKITIAN